MTTTVPIVAPCRFKEAREAAGLEVEVLARDLEITPESVWDLEMCEGEWRTCLSPVQLLRFCRTTATPVIELFGAPEGGSPLTPVDLARSIQDYCGREGLSLGGFGERVGWEVDGLHDDPSGMLQKIPMDGLIAIADQVGVDWRRVLFGL
ncbi:MAG: hypothetical protein HS113_13210 [Verrucomicrobiales bacterium]|nr:hypothetical protein [Verrucomicrobiales bacterium]